MRNTVVTLSGRALGFLTVLFVSVAAAVAATPAPTPLLTHVAARLAARQPLRIVAVGSSSTEGVGATGKDKTYPSRLQAILSEALPQGLAVVVVNRGIGGEDADDMIHRLPAIIAERPDLVIWQTGSNDALRDVTLDRFVAETRAGIREMQAAGIDVMLMEPQLSERLARTETADQFRLSIRAIGSDMGVPVVRRYDLMQKWLATGQLTYPQMMSADGLHMTDGGYDRLAQTVARSILSAGQAGTTRSAAR
jgi:acyl-CoA thioesterase-1